MNLKIGVILAISIRVIPRLLAGPIGPAVSKDLAGALDKDGTPIVCANGEGDVLYQNRSAISRFGNAVGSSIEDCLGDLFANPDAAIFRFMQRTSVEGCAQEDVITRRNHLRISLHEMSDNVYGWRFETLFDHQEDEVACNATGLPMAAVRPSGELLYVNAALAELVGRDVESIDQIASAQSLTTGDIAAIATQEGPESHKVTRVTNPTGYDEVYFLPLGAGDEHAQATVGASLAVESLPVPLIGIDAEGRLADINARARKLFGRPVAEGEYLSDVFEGLGRSVNEWLEDAREGRLLGRPEFLKVTNPDKEIYLQVTLSRVDEPQKTETNPVSLLAVLSDATELKTLEAKFVQSQKMQAIGQLAGGVAHDFNNLLTAISGHCDLLLLRHDQSDPDYADLVQIHQNANRAASLVGQLLAFSRKQNLQPETLDVRDTLADLTHLLNRLVGEKVSLVLKHDPELKPIRADKRQLEQVLMNLVVNARDAMPEGGTIEISTSVVTLTSELQRGRATVPIGEYVVMQVADQGVGIPEDKLPKIFEPFYTTKRLGEGTGLGLSTAYGIVKQTGGYIFSDSEVGTGTTFWLYFPAAKEESGVTTSRPAAHSNGKATVQGDGVVLLVEDEAPVRAFASRALRMRGYTVIEAESAEEALELLDDHTLKVDVFVTDVIMPGLDGPTWVRQALKTRPEVNVIFVSGYAEESLTNKQSRIPNSVFLPKPFSLTELTATVMEQTRKSSQNRRQLSS